MGLVSPAHYVHKSLPCSVQNDVDRTQTSYTSRIKGNQDIVL